MFNHDWLATRKFRQQARRALREGVCDPNEVFDIIILKKLQRTYC